MYTNEINPSPEGTRKKANLVQESNALSHSKAVQVHLALVLNWFDFHLSSFKGVAVTFPMIPLYTCPGGRMFAVKILAIQVGVDTAIEPPGPFESTGTVARIFVVVTIFGGERRTTMIGKRVTSTSYEIT